MIIIIQCAARKNPEAGCLTCRGGMPVLFVANPEMAPESTHHVYARPDDISDSGMSWRDWLLEYNRNPGSNPLGLLPAWQLYENGIYRKLVEKFGLEKVYILSAGWGLIAADFLTPNYDITFSAAAKRENKYKRRKKQDRYKDFCMLSLETTEPIIFFGGKDYVSLFCSLTVSSKGERVLFYNSLTKPDAPGCTLKRYETTTRTNWHYGCAEAFIKLNAPAAWPAAVI